MKRFIILFYIILLNVLLFNPGKLAAQTQHFQKCWEGQQPFSPMTIFIIGAKLDGKDLMSNDEIGIFDGNLCVGAGVANGTISLTNLLELIVSKNDGMSGLGFTEGNPITFKIWIASTKQEILLKKGEIQFHDLQTGNPVNPVPFTTLGTAAVSLEGKTEAKSSYHVKQLPDNLTLPTIDGKINEFFWSFVKEDTLKFGGIPGSWQTTWNNWDDNLVTWKAVWSKATNKLYVAITVQDEIRGTFDNNIPGDASFQPWQDDGIEIFTDGNHDGGFYEGSYDKAQQWFITGENLIVLDDYPNTLQYTPYTGTDVITAVSTDGNGNWTCEAEFNIYDTFPTIRKTLAIKDTIGWNIWYDDSDDLTLKNTKYVRDHQVGWQYTGPADTNANYFGNIILDEDLAYIMVTSPNGGEYWKVGTSKTIEWYSHNFQDEVTIKISADSGMTWTTIAPNVPNTGSYLWTPTAAFIFNNCLVKITSIVDNNISDQSDAVFIISDKEKVDLWINKDISGIKGKTVTIPISASDVTDLQVYSARIMITCDANVIEFTDVDISGTLLESVGWDQPTKNISTGQIVLAMAGTSPLTGNGVLIKIVGNIIGNKGDSTALKFDQAKLNEGVPVVFTNNGLLKVLTGFDIMGQLGYYSAPTTAINDATVQLSGATTQSYVTDKNGNYEFLALPSNDYTVTPEKSNDKKEAISPLDASLILQYEVGLIKLTPYQKIAGDVSDSGEVTSFDASWILRYSIGSVKSFPVGADWTFVLHDFPIDDNNWQTSPRSRSYLALNSDHKAQNFLGILYGDVSGNWASAGSISNITINVQIGDVQQISEGTWQFSINMQFFDQSYSGSFKIIFNKSVLQYQSASLTNPTSNIIFETSSSEEGANFAFASGVSLDKNSLKVKLQLKGLTSTTPSPSDIGIENVILDDNPGIISAIENKATSPVPIEWHLSQNHPNPFNSETSISYQVPKAAPVKIEIFNLLGQHLKTLVNENKSPGIFKLTWDGKDEQGRFVGSGIFICRMQAREFAAVKKIVLIQ